LKGIIGSMPNQSLPKPASGRPSWADIPILFPIPSCPWAGWSWAYVFWPRVGPSRLLGRAGLCITSCHLRIESGSGPFNYPVPIVDCYEFVLLLWFKELELHCLPNFLPRRFGSTVYIVPGEHAWQGKIL
jgi:hypothetical protein